MIKFLVFGISLLTIVIADIRIDNNDLSGDGQWSISLNPNGTKSILQLPNTNSNNQQTTVKDNMIQQNNQEDESDTQEDQEQQLQAQSVEKSDINIFDYFTKNSGSCLVFFYDSILADSLQNKQKVDSLSIRFHDPKYLDQKIIVLKVKLSNYNFDSDDWQIATSTVNYTYYENLQQKMHGSMKVAYKVAKQNIKFFIGDNQLSISYKKKQYNLIVPLIILTFTFLTLYAVIRFQKRQIAVEKVSIITLYHNVFFYIYLSTFFLIIGMAALPGPMSILLICGCIQILISVKLIRKFQTIIQRFSNLNGYCVFYCGIFIYVWLLFNYFYTPAFILINSLFLVPQIVHNIRCGNKLGNQYEYLAILVSPQIYFLYLKGYSDNVLHYHPQPVVCLGIIALVSIQLWIIYNQNQKGPFFFIKKSWLPNYFDYYKTFELNSKSDLYEQQCAICLCSLSQLDPITSAHQLKTDNKTDQDLNGQNQIHNVKKVTLMITPCQHKFHPVCLQQWLEYKRECPVDRSIMPMLYK